MTTPTRQSRGFTLVEMLIALIVLSIGLLGVAALQISSLRSNGSAASRSQATLLAYEIVDRMRANQVAARAGAYDIAFGANPAGGTVAGDDLTAWRTNLAATLGSTATSSIVRNGAGAATTFVVSIRWSDATDTGEARAPLTLAMETQL